MGGEHRCPVCDATFTRPQHVARHMRSHTGDRPYRCQFCPDQFARSDLLSRHVNKCHPAEKPPAGPPGRKGSRAALRAATSKQICDQCVRSALVCDGAKPCARCTQRNVPCTFVDFHRQTAPQGPGHPHHSSPPPATHPPFSTAALQPPLDVQHAQQSYIDPSSAWYGSDHLQTFMSSRPGDYAPSVASDSVPSSASSSSSHLPIEDIHQLFQLDDTYHPPPEDTQALFHSAFGVLSIHDPGAASFFPSVNPQQVPQTGILNNVVGTGMMGDPNATPMSHDDLAWTHLINTTSPNHPTPTPAAFQFRRRAASMFSVRTPIAAPQAFIHPDHAVQRLQPPHHDQFQRQPIQQPVYSIPLPVDDLSSWSAKIHSQPPPELRLAAAKVKARRQTLSGGERDRERNSQLPPAPAFPFPSTSSSGPDGKLCVVNPTSFTEYRDSASPVDSHTRSSSSSTASWESAGITSESAMRPSFKRLPSATPLENDREHKRVLISYPADNDDGSVGPKIEDAVATPLEHDHERERGFVSYGSRSAEGVVTKTEDGEGAGAELGRFLAGPAANNRHIVNLAERRRGGADAGGGGGMTLNLHLGTL